ncbi:MAG: hypothetical protein BWY06_00907 [Candidatus Latescibacteria bacterium ADurb.Bin168]|nr:MAG: hypothetical protein BWY06_00907 [Candidatus Latescibacteria bacterium ADurb.Bin168]
MAEETRVHRLRVAVGRDTASHSHKARPLQVLVLDSRLRGNDTTAAGADPQMRYLYREQKENWHGLPPVSRCAEQERRHSRAGGNPPPIAKPCRFLGQ